MWCRRTDELVDGPNAIYMSSTVLDRWEERLHDIFDGRPYDMLDSALTDTVFNFPLDIKVSDQVESLRTKSQPPARANVVDIQLPVFQPFQDMIEGMRMDIRKSRYENFRELFLYCYHVAGTVGVMSVPVMGIAPESRLSPQNIYSSALYLGIGNQLTNILRDVGEE